MLRSISAAGSKSLVRRSGLTAAAARDACGGWSRRRRGWRRAFSNALIAPHEAAARRQPRYRVALLTGCVQDLVFPDVNRDTADVLLANGCTVDTPPAQPCCGSLHAHNGDLDRARQLARQMIDLFPPIGTTRSSATPADADRTCGTTGRCSPTIRSIADARRQWDAKVRDVHEWLVEIGCRPPRAAPFARRPPSRTTSPATWRTGRRSSRAAARAAPAVARRVARRIDGIDLVLRRGGIYALTQPEQAEQLLGRKTAHIVATGASLVATANPGCQLQIARGLGDASVADRRRTSRVAARVRLSSRTPPAGVNRGGERELQAPFRLNAISEGYRLVSCRSASNQSSSGDPPFLPRDS